MSKVRPEWNSPGITGAAGPTGIQGMQGILGETGYQGITGAGGGGAVCVKGTVPIGPDSLYIAIGVPMADPATGPQAHMFITGGSATGGPKGSVTLDAFLDSSAGLSVIASTSGNAYSYVHFYKDGSAVQAYLRAYSGMSYSYVVDGWQRLSGGNTVSLTLGTPILGTPPGTMYWESGSWTSAVTLSEHSMSTPTLDANYMNVYCTANVASINSTISNSDQTAVIASSYSNAVETIDSAIIASYQSTLGVTGNDIKYSMVAASAQCGITGTGNCSSIISSYLSTVADSYQTSLIASKSSHVYNSANTLVAANNSTVKSVLNSQILGDNLFIESEITGANGITVLGRGLGFGAGQTNGPYIDKVLHIGTGYHNGSGGGPISGRYTKLHGSVVNAYGHISFQGWDTTIPTTGWGPNYYDMTGAPGLLMVSCDISYDTALYISLKNGYVGQEATLTLDHTTSANNAYWLTLGMKSCQMGFCRAIKVVCVPGRGTFSQNPYEPAPGGPVWTIPDTLTW